MIDFNCIVQEGFVPEEVRPGLAAELARISTSILGGSLHDVEVDFNEIPKGFGFRGGELSGTSLVRGSIDGCEQAVRVKLLRKIGDMWCAITSCSPDEIVVSIRDRHYLG